ncbi:MAG: FliH/SctL family protein [Pirellulales bacterium]
MATIIRRDRDRESAPGLIVRGVAFSFDEFSHKAEHYLADVRGEAARIVQDAKRDAEAIRRQAEHDGRSAAEQAAHRVLDEKVSRQMATLGPALESAVAQLVDARGVWLDHWQNCAIQLAAAMAERVVRRELQQRPEIAIQWVREALELAAGATEVVIHLHPADLEGLGSQIDQIAETFSGLAPARVRADENIARGGCVVHTKFGAIDQQISTQLDRLVFELN